MSYSTSLRMNRRNSEEDYVYDRGRNALNERVVSNFSSAITVEEISNQRVQYDSIPSIIRLISQEDLKFNDNGNELGSTKNAKVVLGYFYQRSRSTGILGDFEERTEVAIKEPLQGTTTQAKLIKGIEPWAKIKNSNVIEIIGLCPRLDNKLPLIVMECGRGGSLKNFIQKVNFSIPEKIIVKWAYQISAGMASIHDYDVAHRDLCSNNIVMSNNGETIEEMENNILKIIDVNDQDSQGTPLNWSPDDPITKKSDVFSFGSVIWELLTRHKEELYDGIKLDYKGLMYRILQGLAKKETFIIPSDVNSELATIIRECWNFNAELRPSFPVLMQKLSDLEKNLPECIELQYDVEDEQEKGDYEDEDEDEEYDYDEDLTDQVETSDVYQDENVSSEHAFNLESYQEIEQSEFNPEDISIPNSLF